MNKNTVAGAFLGFVGGLTVGTSVALTSVYFMSNRVLRKGFLELRDEFEGQGAGPSTGSEHLDRARAALSPSATEADNVVTDDTDCQSQ